MNQEVGKGWLLKREKSIVDKSTTVCLRAQSASRVGRTCLRTGTGTSGRVWLVVNNHTLIGDPFIVSLSFVYPLLFHPFSGVRYPAGAQGIKSSPPGKSSGKRPLITSDNQTRKPHSALLRNIFQSSVINNHTSQLSTIGYPPFLLR